MRKFTIQSKKGKTAIMEVECEIVRPMEDSSVMWLNPGEYKARILAPTSFHQKIEKSVDGKKEFVLVPDVWCWHAFHDSLDEAKEKAIQSIRNSFVWNEKKYHTPYTEEEVQKAIDEIEVVML